MAGNDNREKIECDVVVVGGGSAGCVVASRLSADSNLKVVLLEAGPDDRSWRIAMPSALDSLISGTDFNWAYQTQPEPELGGRSVDHPRGRVLGGSSAINGMVYTRGHALDFDAWAQQYGCPGWSYADVLPYFIREEMSQWGNTAYRGGSGPLQVSTPNMDSSPLNSAFMAGGREAGYPLTNDSNAFCQEGFGPNEQTIGNGRRCSSARAYLTPSVRARPNLRILTGALAERILITNGRAMGVHCRQNGRRLELRAAREVIVCAGAFGSPHLLLLSGIGPHSALTSAGIAPVHDLPGVGRNLQDHPDLVLQVECRRPVTLLPITKSPRRELVGLQWFWGKTGPAASNHFEAAAYIRTRAGIRHPNLKLELLPLAFRPGTLEPYAKPAFQIHMTQLRAGSRGEVTLSSPDPTMAPRIQFNYLQDPLDLRTFREAVRLTREVVATRAMAAFSGNELDPGGAIQDDGALDDWIRERVATAYHPAGTCRMGPRDDGASVVGPDLKVHGLEGLRIADASIMPVVVSANTNASSIMIGDRAADFVLGQRASPSETARFWTHPQWETQQR
jgi:choline dehydrogenase